MAQPKEPYELPKISTKVIGRLQPGESVIVGPCNPTAVSAEFARLGGVYEQRQVIVVEPRSAEAVKMYAVTKVERAEDSKQISVALWLSPDGKVVKAATEHEPGFKAFSAGRKPGKKYIVTVDVSVPTGDDDESEDFPGWRY